jgi:hypothetical protein
MLQRAVNHMQSKDVRIGNWVAHNPSKCKKTNAYFIVSEINTFDKITINGLESEDCEPIPIAEEFFIRFKEVIKVSEEMYFIPMSCVKAKIHLVWFMESWVVELCHEYSNLPIVLDTEFIHELQNIYFALTGEELRIN